MFVPLTLFWCQPAFFSTFTKWAGTHSGYSRHRGPGIGAIGRGGGAPNQTRCVRPRGFGSRDKHEAPRTSHSDHAHRRPGPEPGRGVEPADPRRGWDFAQGKGRLVGSGSARGRPPLPWKLFFSQHAGGLPMGIRHLRVVRGKMDPNEIREAQRCANERKMGHVCLRRAD